MDKIKLIVPTTATRFKIWFNRHWGYQKSIQYMTNPTTYAHLTIQSPQVYPDGEYSYTIHMEYTIVYEKVGEDTGIGYTHLGDLITINATELDSGRVELEIRYIGELVWKELVLPFLEEIKATWRIDDGTIKPPDDTLQVEPSKPQSGKFQNENIKVRRDRVHQLWKQGKTQKEIATICNVSVETIKKDARALGIKFRNT